MAKSGLWNITALIPRASPSGSGRLYSITPRWPWHNYYLFVFDNSRPLAVHWWAYLIVNIGYLFVFGNSRPLIVHWWAYLRVNIGYLFVFGNSRPLIVHWWAYLRVNIGYLFVFDNSRECSPVTPSLVLCRQRLSGVTSPFPGWSRDRTNFMVDTLSKYIARDT